MGTVFRQTRTRPLPVGAEVFTKAGQRFARWKPAKGKTRTAKVTSGEDGTLRIQTVAATYTAKFRNGQGVIREVSTGCRDEDAARSVLSKLERRAELVRSEIISSAEDATADHQLTPLNQHFAAFHEHRTAKGLSSVRIANTKSRLDRLADDCGFGRLADCSAEALTRWLNCQQANGMSPGNRNEYRQELVGFGNWCVETHRLSANPFSKVPKADAKLDRRRQRRSMTEAELMQLLDVARWRPLAEYGRETTAPDVTQSEGAGNRRKRSNWKLAALTLDGLQAAVVRARERLAKNPDFVAKLERLGRERALIYKTLVLTGLRKGELASLTVGQFNLDAPMPFVELDAAYEKNRQGSTIPLRLDLANDLREWLSDVPSVSTLRLRDHNADADSDRRLFRVPAGLVQILNRDLNTAGIPKRDERGRTLDVHALRGTFATLLSKGGVTPRTAQAAMRHSTIDLTMNAYTDPKLLDVCGALDSLPSLNLNASPSTNRTAMRATGTDCRESWRSTDSPKDSPTNSPDAGKSRLLGSFPVIASGKADRPTTRRANDENPAKPKEKALFAGFANKAFPVERKGVEPSTSALRTQRSPN